MYKYIYSPRYVGLRRRIAKKRKQKKLRHVNMHSILMTRHHCCNKLNKFEWLNMWLLPNDSSQRQLFSSRAMGKSLRIVRWRPVVSGKFLQYEAILHRSEKRIQTRVGECLGGKFWILINCLTHPHLEKKTVADMYILDISEKFDARMQLKVLCYTRCDVSQIVKEGWRTKKSEWVCVNSEVCVTEKTTARLLFDLKIDSRFDASSLRNLFVSQMFDLQKFCLLWK
jgi:hypothetical protein